VDFNGKVASSKIAELKFQVGGKLSLLNCKISDNVKKGQLLASLEKTELQAYLDRALKQYDLERALFDEKQKEQLTEYEKRKYQDSLDISIKNVEIAKANLDATDLFTPIEGMIIRMDSNLKGVNITPSGFVITILGNQSFVFEAEVPEENLSQFTIGQTVKVNLKIGKTIAGKVEKIGLEPIKETNYPIEISLSDQNNLRLGLTGKVEV